MSKDFSGVENVRTPNLNLLYVSVLELEVWTAQTDRQTAMRNVAY